ncbi:MAG: YhfC family glutamic-type intramembrane protease, partial [Oscillospiraceae bacterium]
MDTVVSGSEFAIYGVTAFFTTILPLFIAIGLIVTKKISSRPFIVGAGAFFISQVILRMPLLRMFGTQEWYVNFASTVLGLVIIGGLTAGIFEETARYFGAKLFLRNETYFSDAVGFGLGHAFCEVILFVGASNINAIFNGIALNKGTFIPTLVAQGAPQGYIDEVVANIANPQVFDAAMAILERVSVVGIHVAMTVLVFTAINKKNILYYFAAILVHTITNSVPAFIDTKENLLLV